MRKICKVLFVAAPLFFFLGCTENQFEDDAVTAGMASASQEIQGNLDRCATMKVLTEKIKENPGLKNRMQAIENQTQRFVQNQSTEATATSVPYEGTVTIPVYVNVIYNTDAENITLKQIDSQLEILNKDFNAENSDIGSTPDYFQNVIGKLNVQFVRAEVKRKYSRKTSWGTRDAMKFSKKGGIDATNPEKALNIWVCNIGGGVLGYAQFPGGDPATDGIVVGPQYFGNTGYVAAPFDKGRTATHEVGHWLNLRHIWGDGGCGVDDFVADTPLSDGPNYGCPGKTTRCNNINMTMNFMDYTDDRCMYMFTDGQRSRTRALFASDGARRALVSARQARM